MKTRILSGLVLAPFLALLYFGGYLLMAGCIFVGVVGLYEFYKGFRNLDARPSYPIGLVSLGLLYVANIFVVIAQEKDIIQDGSEFYLLWMFLTVVISLLYMFSIEKRELIDSLVTIVGVFYVVFFSFHLMLIDEIPGKASILIWTVVIAAFGTDIFAYFSGMALGKHKLCPKISPKKTIEGAVGGTLGSVILCLVFGLIFAKSLLVHCIIIGIIGAVVSQFGDLTASIFKRKMGIKDYGNLIPGHGGILDRFDSVIFVAPFVYYYIELFVA